MENHFNTISKRLSLILLLFISSLIYSQNKAMIPVSGTIVFAKKEEVLDKELYLKSLKELLPKLKDALKQQIIFERLDQGKGTDTTALKSEVDKLAQNFEMMFPFLIEENLQKEIKFHHQFNESKIIKYVSFNGELIGERIIISPITFEVTNEYNEHTEIASMEVLKVTEFRNETKIVNGYKCFKVVYTYIEPQSTDLDFVFSGENNSRELWVTEEIKCNYHPVVNESEILKKYYPLEIIEYSEEIKGFVTHYQLEEFSLNE